MSKYLTFNALNSVSKTYAVKYELNESKRSSASAASIITVFLSHRHSEDQSLIKKVKGFFAEQGATVYIDWLDKDMPEVTGAETAEKLKTKIKQCKKFVILATPESIKSIWIPWEIGLADQIKGFANMAILPIVDDENTWDQREYYRLYSRITEIEQGWCVVKPENKFTGDKLTDWLRS